MSMTPAVRAILANYESDNPGTKANLARILMQGRLGGTMDAPPNPTARSGNSQRARGFRLQRQRDMS